MQSSDYWTQLTVHSVVASIFEDYLRSTIEDQSLPMRLEYQPATLDNPRSIILVSIPRRPDVTCKESVIFKLTTPLFYTNLALSNNTADFILSTLKCQDPLKSVLYTNHPDRIQTLFVKKGDETCVLPRLPSWERIRWLPIYLLRGLKMSDLDMYSMAHSSKTKPREYRRVIFKLLVAKYLTLGFVEMIDLGLWLVRTWLLWQCLEGLADVLLGRWEVYSLLLTSRSSAPRLWGYHVWCGLGQLL